MDKVFIPEWPNTVIVGEQVAGEAAQTCQQLQQVISLANSSMFDIAELLYKIKKNGYYTKTHNTFFEFIKSLNFKQRRLRYLTTIAEVMDTVGIERKQYEPLGIAKLREITSLDPTAEWVDPETGDKYPMSEFIKGLINKGPDLQLEDIRHKVRTLKGLVGPDEMVWLHLYIKKTVLENVITPALEKAKGLIGSVGKDEEGNSIDPSNGQAAEAVFADFLSGE